MKAVLVYGLAGWEPEKEARVVLKAIRGLGYRSIFVCDKENDTMALADRAEINGHWSYDFLKNIALEERVDLALLIVDFASPLIGRLNRELGLPGPTDEHYAAVSDKLAWSRLAQQQGLKMPRELLATSLSDLEAWASDRPFIVKPTKSTGNVSSERFGYRYYSSMQSFREQLQQSGDLERFFELNKTGTPLGRYLIQEQLNYKLWGNLGLTVMGREILMNEMHDRYFHPFPDQTYQYASIGPVSLTEKHKTHAEKVCEIFKQVGFKNTGLNIDIIETPEGDLFTVDVNVRFGSTWSTFLPLRKIQYYEQAIEGFLGRPYELPELRGAYLRHKVDLPPGVIESVTWPRSLDPRIRLEGTEYCQPGVQVAATTGRHTWPVEALVVGDSMAECWELYNQMKSEIKVVYRETASC